MQVTELNGIHVNYRDEGEGPAVVFCNSLGTDMRLWDKVLPLLRPGLRLIRYDKRGHGLTDATPAPYGMGTLVRDAEVLLDHLEVRDCVFMGCSIGGLIAQGLAAKRLDQVRALVLSNTGAKIGTREMWQQRLDLMAREGVEALADTIMERWFSPPFREGAEMIAWRNLLTRTPLAGYSGCSAAIAGTDFYTTTAALSLPALGIAGGHDGSTPPDLVRETMGLIKGSRFELIQQAGHLPMIEQPEAYAQLLNTFFEEIGHG
ncbi:3-oxoadipate enol-lactonase [Alkalilacustris brevis]|uniref:3-oxoadipate enol-lactonase n=1 Tax=Alkalilacustris brevis TaxID=2026338 RepID=UPI000E0D3DA4|nr:3-oxoadipate enol-lactonase [Alkalilacustris brevis]